MKPNEYLEEIEKDLGTVNPESKNVLFPKCQIEWLIDRVKTLTQALESLSTYEFSIYDKTGALIKQHCKDALEQE